MASEMMNQPIGSGGPRRPDLSGWQGSKSYFRLVESIELRPSLIADVLCGRQLGVIFRDVVPLETRKEMTSRFLMSPGRKKRGSDAPGEYLGAYHYNKTTAEYLDQSAAVRSELEEVLDVPAEPLRELRRVIRQTLALEGIQFRSARHDGREACPGIFRSWLGEKQFALDPHEDRGQCEDLKQAGFEIQQVAAHQIVAINICLDNGSDGQLVVWNMRPDEATRIGLGVQYTGSPYAIEWLTGIDHLHLDVRPGDIYLFNAAHVHAVEPVRDVGARRVTLSGMMGFADSKTVVSWT